MPKVHAICLFVDSQPRGGALFPTTNVILEWSVVIIKFVNQLSKAFVEIIFVEASVLVATFELSNSETMLLLSPKCAFTLEDATLVVDNSSIAIHQILTKLSFVLTVSHPQQSLTLFLVRDPVTNIPVSIGPCAVAPATSDPLALL